MRLTTALSYFVRRKHIPGALYSGKNKLVPRITPSMKKRAVEQLIMEERNMDMLSRPFLTEAEDYRHMVDSGRYQERIDRLKHERIQANMLKHKSMVDYFSHLKMEEKWE